jgi:hypothetical protein
MGEGASIGSRVVNRLNSLFVSIYKTIGMAALVVILVGLLAYFALQAFFLVNRSWMAPVILSASHEKVVTLNAQFVQQTQARDLLEAQRMELEARLADADRIVTAQERFLAAYGAALDTEREAAADELEDLARLGRDWQRTQTEMDGARRAYVDLTRQNLDSLFQTRLIDKESFVGRHFTLAQTAQSAFATAETGRTLRWERDRLERRSLSLNAVADRPAVREAIPEGVGDYGVLVMEQQRALAVLELQRARDGRQAIQRGITAIRDAMGGYDRILDGIRHSPYLRALDARVAIAFVPYDNLPNCAKDVRVYGCSLGLVWCRKVGTVKGVLDGEVTIKHPRSSEVLRGQMVELSLEDPLWAQEPVLHAGGRPFLL